MSYYSFLMGVDHRGNITLCCAVSVIPHFISDSLQFFPLLQFCVDTVTRFTKNPMCLQKAGMFLFIYLFIYNIYPIIESQMGTVYIKCQVSLFEFPYYFHHLSALPACLQELYLPATTRTTHQECISPCQCFYHSSGLCSKPAWCLISSQYSAPAWPTR